MPGANCSIYGCGTSRGRKNYEGVSIFKIPGTKPFQNNTQEQQLQWRKEFLSCVTKDRVVDAGLADQISKDNIYICEKHFSPESILRK